MAKHRTHRTHSIAFKRAVVVAAGPIEVSGKPLQRNGDFKVSIHHPNPCLAFAFSAVQVYVEGVNPGTVFALGTRPG